MSESAQHPHFPDDVNRIIADLESQGIEVVHGEPGGNHDCQRCGYFTSESRFGVCFACAMLESPESSDDEIKAGLEDLQERQITLGQWFTARQQWGTLVPTTEDMVRIQLLHDAPN